MSKDIQILTARSRELGRRSVLNYSNVLVIDCHSLLEDDDLHSRRHDLNKSVLDNQMEHPGPCVCLLWGVVVQGHRQTLVQS